MASGWPGHPVIYEINTWPWVVEVCRDHGRGTTLAEVPADAWDRLAEMAIDAVWLMGVWERSAAGAEVSRNEEWLRRFGREQLRGFTPEDVVGSAYCVRRYVPDGHLGGAAGLQIARQELAARGLKLILDFVPNHVALDHAWATRHPEYLMRGDEHDLEHRRREFARVGGNVVVAHGRDRYTVWRDVLQLNTFHAGLREAAVETLAAIAGLCDGVRCDMAMLPITDIVAELWGERAGPPPVEEYWPVVIGAVRDRSPEFLFVAEVYWDLEARLLAQGFDYCYDKRLYDRLLEGDADGTRDHLRGAEVSFQSRLLRFTENHDEARAAAVIPPGMARAAAVATATLPGATLWHEGQFEGRRLKVPVELRRRPDEAGDVELAGFHRALLAAARDVRHGDWAPCDVTDWPDNHSGRNILAWRWRGAEETFIVAVNLGTTKADGRVRFPVPGSSAGSCVLVEMLTNERFLRDRAELRDQGLYVRLPPHGFHVLRLRI